MNNQLAQKDEELSGLRVELRKAASVSELLEMDVSNVEAVRI
jgi:hypothetical protein